MRRRSYLMVAIAVLVVVSMALTACGNAPQKTPAAGDQSNNGSQSDKVITVKASDYKFNPDKVEIPVNAVVKLTLVNESDANEHDLVIQNLSSDQFELISTTMDIQKMKKNDPDFDPTTQLHIHAHPGEQATMVFRMKKAGDYTFKCLQPGHADLGMVGTLTVTK